MGSLFSGIGLLDYGVEMAFRDAGIQIDPKFQVETNPFCRAVLTKHWPTVPKHEDVTRVGSTGPALPAVDLIVGGPPCQDISFAGNGAGLDGERSGLAFEYLRIVSELKPAAIILENVAGLVRRGLDRIVSGLSGLGYEVEATRLEAEDIGAPHRRQRLLLVAYASSMLGNVGKHIGVGGIGSGGWRKVPKSGDRSRHYGKGPNWQTPVSFVGRMPDGRTDWLDGYKWPAPPGVQFDWEPPRLEMNVPQKSQRLKALGNAVVPQCAYVAAMRVIQRMTSGQASEAA